MADLSKLIDEQLIAEEENLSEIDVANRASDADLFYRKWFKKFLAKITAEDLKTFANDRDAGFHNGSLYMIQLIKDWFDKQTSISQDKPKSPEEPENGLPTVGDNPIQD
jgi:hypothetical protein